MADDRHQGRVGRVELEDAHEKIERLKQQQRDHAAATGRDTEGAVKKQTATDTEKPQTAKPKGDHFREATRLEKFAGRLLQKVGRDSPNDLRLPSGRLLRDQRGASKAEGGEQSAQRMSSQFEEAMVKRFEGGRSLGRALAEGKASFLKKTAQQWMSFFRGFMQRTVKKEVSLRGLQEQHIFRAVLKHSGADARGTLISDLHLRNGHVEKFARLRVNLTNASQNLQQLQPGAELTTQMMGELQDGGDSLQYLAIGPRPPEEKTFEPRATTGIFTNQRTEDEVARRLGLARKGSRSELSSNLQDRERRERFVPFGLWDREERGGAKRWFVPVAMGVVIIALAIGGWLMFRSL